MFRLTYAVLKKYLNYRAFFINLDTLSQNASFHQLLTYITTNMNSKSKRLSLNQNMQPFISTLLTSDDMEFAWLASHGNTRIVCNGLGHRDIYDCLKEFVKKLIDTGKVASKYYIFFHAIPLIIKLRKTKDLRAALNYIKNSCYEYIKSLCFMAFLVGLLRGAMCTVNHCAAQPSLKLAMLPGCFGSAVSILFEGDSRGKQIGYFVFSKALRSCYICFKRLLGFKFQHQQIAMHMLLMSILYYVYNHQGDSLKFKNLFDMVFGKE